MGQGLHWLNACFSTNRLIYRGSRKWPFFGGRPGWRLRTIANAPAAAPADAIPPPMRSATHGGWGTENSVRAKSPSCQRTSHVIAKPVQPDRRTGDLRRVGLRSRPCGDRDARSRRRAGRPRPGDRTGSRADRRHGLRPRRPQLPTLGHSWRRAAGFSRSTAASAGSPSRRESRSVSIRISPRSPTRRCSAF